MLNIWVFPKRIFYAIWHTPLISSEYMKAIKSHSCIVICVSKVDCATAITPNPQTDAFFNRVVTQRLPLANLWSPFRSFLYSLKNDEKKNGFLAQSSRAAKLYLCCFKTLPTWLNSQFVMLHKTLAGSAVRERETKFFLFCAFSWVEMETKDTNESLEYNWASNWKEQRIWSLLSNTSQHFIKLHIRHLAVSSANMTTRVTRE